MSRKFTVTYHDEKGNASSREFDDEKDAINAFLALSPGDDYAGFPISDEWPMMGYVTETLAIFGFSTLAYTYETGHSMSAIHYEREA